MERLKHRRKRSFQKGYIKKEGKVKILVFVKRRDENSSEQRIEKMDKGNTNK